MARIITPSRVSRELPGSLRLTHTHSHAHSLQGLPSLTVLRPKDSVQPVTSHPGKKESRGDTHIRPERDIHTIHSKRQTRTPCVCEAHRERKRGKPKKRTYATRTHRQEDTMTRTGTCVWAAGLWFGFTLFFTRIPHPLFSSTRTHTHIHDWHQSTTSCCKEPPEKKRQISMEEWVKQRIKGWKERHKDSRRR